MMKTKYLATALLLGASATASAFWGGPFMGNGYGNNYNNGYGSQSGNFGMDQYRGGDAAGGGDFSMNLSGRGNTDMRGSGNSYGAGDGWGRGYNNTGGYGNGYNNAPYYGGMPAYGYPRQPMPYPQGPQVPQQ